MKKSGNKKKKSLPVVIALCTVIVLAAILLFVAIAFLQKIRRVNEDEQQMIPREEETFETDENASDTASPEDISWDETTDTNVMDDQDVKNILLIGQDRRANEGRSRSDSMIICSINTKKKTVTLVSLMRDMYVPIPGYSDNRINSAYKSGGMKLLDQTIEQNFGVPIHGNVEVDFERFVSAMSAVGDIEIDLNEEEAYYLSHNEKWIAQAGTDASGWEFEEGPNLLTPEQALAYSRIRYIGNKDYERTERQRKVLKSAIRKVKSLPLTDQIAIAEQIMPSLATDMSNSEILGYVYTVITNDMNVGDTYRIPVEGGYTPETISGMNVLVPDLTINSRELQRFLYWPEAPETPESTNTESKASYAEE